MSIQVGAVNWNRPAALDLVLLAWGLSPLSWVAWASR
jgi:hypothetical protein